MSALYVPTLVHPIPSDLGSGSSSGSGGGMLSGSGSPEGVVTADPDTWYRDTDGDGALWIKETGTGNTGWVEWITA
jgi:hypothetical protein